MKKNIKGQCIVIVVKIKQKSLNEFSPYQKAHSINVLKTGKNVGINVLYPKEITLKGTV